MAIGLSGTKIEKYLMTPGGRSCNCARVEGGTQRDPSFKHLETGHATGYALRSVEIGVTSRCNFRCDYCCAYDLNEKRTLDAAEVIESLSALSDLERVKLSGGEVLLEFDTCRDIVQWCASQGLHTQINTNGTLLDQQRILELERAGLNILHVSLNHVDVDGHSAFYRVGPKFFDKIVQTLRAAAGCRRLEAVAETILFSETVDRIAEVHRFVASLGVRKHEIQAEIPSIHSGYGSVLGAERVAGGIRALLEARVDGVELFFSCLSAYFGDDSPHWSVFDGHIGPGRVSVARCIEGKSQLHVHSDGSVLICELGWPEPIGNVFETSLANIFRSPPEPLRAFLDSGHNHFAGVCHRKCDHPRQPHALASRLPATPVLITNLVRKKRSISSSSQ